MTDRFRREHFRIVVNAATNALYFATTVVVVFFVSPILVHELGDSRYGTWLLVNSVMAYLALADLGIGASVLRYVARFDGLRDNLGINRVFSTSVAIFAAMGGVVLVVSSLLALFWTDPFGVGPTLAVDMRWMIALLGVNLAFLLPLGTYKTVLMGLGRYPMMNAVRVTTLLLRNGGFVLALHYGGGLRAIAVITVACSLLDQVWCLFAAHYYLPSLRCSFRFINRETLGHIWGYSAFVFLSSIVSKIGTESNTLVVGMFLPAAAVAYYGVASGLSYQAVGGLLTSITVLTQAVSRWEGMGNQGAISRLLVTGSRQLLLLTVPIQIGLLTLGRPFLALWMGPRYAELSYPVLAILSFSLPFTMATAISARILEGMGKVSILFWSTVLQSTLTVAMNVVLVGRLGIEGAAWGTVVPIIVQSVVVIVLACRTTDVRFSTYASRVWMKPLFAAGVLGMAWVLLAPLLPARTSWGALSLAGACGIALYLPLVVFLDPHFRQLSKQAWSRVVSLSNQVLGIPKEAVAVIDDVQKN